MLLEQEVRMRRFTDCNNCSTGSCKGADTLKDIDDCTKHTFPRSGWMLAELALAHPNSLNESLRVLPYEVNLGFYLK